ncbi:DUF998 domain-containing protein [Marivirga sp. S37H4]|uniref:DUF998 domain-containing protein n=1 Tax=Marivirga aurantiaca TaxID=2802615 RepID=A0A934WVL4_9BACT|nr:DUF998 domain-containing protein [Marivirga aurantiaca]MBK6263745.1 DUF998 domain-containing protein [Marivirga aurantiaca]
MNNKLVFWVGLLGTALFFVASVLGGFQFEDYNPVSQLISESMAIGTPYGKTLRYFGYIPSGILITIFSIQAIKKFPPSAYIKYGFGGIALFYGIATIIVGLFPCDVGCNKELIDPSVSQLIHNLTGFLTYIFVPISIINVGAGLRNLKVYPKLSNVSIICAIVSIGFISLLIADPLTTYAGLYQRIVESTFMIWIIACAISIKNSKLSEATFSSVKVNK